MNNIKGNKIELATFKKWGKAGVIGHEVQETNGKSDKHLVHFSNIPTLPICTGGFRFQKAAPALPIKQTISRYPAKIAEKNYKLSFS